MTGSRTVLASLWVGLGLNPRAVGMETEWWPCVIFLPCKFGRGNGRKQPRSPERFYK